MNRIQYMKVVVAVNATLPLGLLLMDLQAGRLGVNPVEYFLRATGVVALIILLATLAVSPLRKLTGFNELIRIRRMLGLFAFLYASIHLATYSVLEMGLDLGDIITDIGNRPFIAVGMAAFLGLVALAITSTNAMIKRLGGKNWARLHMLIYPIAVLGVIHFWMIVKSDIFYPALFAAAAAVLLGYRVVSKVRKRQIIKPDSTRAN
ncbi:MAG: sulfoxide reductase heme-binding subunit YedZ [Blastocatellia bacterium]|nr:sulfoxide reductase heme-binding subunit YedZ [Blastocatellia bacterium]